VCVFGLFFFFQAEDGIRDFHVTGVQTCALPISGRDKCGLPPLGFGEGGGELLSDRPFLLPRIAGKVPQSDLSIRVKHRATGEGVGRTTPPRLLSPIPRVAQRAPLRHVRHGWHLPSGPATPQPQPSRRIRRARRSRRSGGSSECLVPRYPGRVSAT